jgi:hypothetical protein
VTLGQKVYEAAQTVWLVSPYYKSWDDCSYRMKRRFDELADALVDAGLIGEQND